MAIGTEDAYWLLPNRTRVRLSDIRVGLLSETEHWVRARVRELDPDQIDAGASWLVFGRQRRMAQMGLGTILLIILKSWS